MKLEPGNRLGPYEIVGALGAGGMGEVYRARDLEPGDVVFAYTDGVTEALNARGVEYGEDRLVDLLLAHRDQPAESIARTVLDALRHHARDPET